MLLPRVIPCLLLRGQGLVKTVNFKDPKYVGDPRNAVKIFNEKEVDELMILDIAATQENRPPRADLIREIAGEAFMPVAYGGGIRTVDQARQVLSLGVEKVVINSAAAENPEFLRNLSEVVGSQSIIVSIDVRKSVFGVYEAYSHCGRKKTGLNPVEMARRATLHGAGELLLTSIDRDGTMKGYDIPLVRSVTAAVNVPVVASGGAGRIEDFAAAVREGGAPAVAAGSMFVFHGKHRAVLISYPEPQALRRVFGTE